MAIRIIGLAAVLLALVALAGSAAASELTLRPGGITLNATLEIADGKKLGDGVILMVHGTMAHKDMDTLRHFRRLFREKGFSTLAFNLGLGLDDRRGMYDCARPSTHCFGDAVAEIGAWLEWLAGRGAKRVVLFGFSRGGQQAAWFAAERGHPALASLVLLAPINPGELAAASRYQAQFGKPLEPLLERARALVKAGQPDVFLEKVAFLNCRETAATAGSFLSYYAPDPKLEMPALLARVKKPVLVVVAGADQMVRDLDRKLAPLADGRRLRLTVVPGADHFFRDLYGEDAVDEIVKFLRP
jgi:pimeloyl-ACP methyl ester carboxylesterase